MSVSYGAAGLQTGQLRADLKVGPSISSSLTLDGHGAAGLQTGQLRPT